MLPTTQIVFPGSYAPAAPGDMFAGLGKNGQIVSVSKRAGLVVVRMGNQAGSGEVAMQLCNGIWEKLNAAMCNNNSVDEPGFGQKVISIYPNPANTEIHIGLASTANSQTEISNLIGEVVIKKQNQHTIDISSLPCGIYFISVKYGLNHYTQKFIRQQK